MEDAHSLYLEALAELGIVGFLLVVGVLALILGGFFLAARGPDRVLGGALFGAALAWALKPGWTTCGSTPPITLWLFAAGGLALAGRARATRAARPAATPVMRRRRIALASGVALASVGLLVLPLRVDRSDGPLRDCPARVRASRLPGHRARGTERDRSAALPTGALCADRLLPAR